VRSIIRTKKGHSIYRTYKIKLVSGRNEIKAIAYNKDNTMNSNEAFHIIEAKFNKINKPTLNVLVIGINEFANPKLSLKYAVPDAELFSNTIRKSAENLFKSINIIKLTDKNSTTKSEILHKLQQYQKLNPNDVFVFYVASHGTVDTGEYFLLTSSVGSTSTKKLKENALTQTELKSLIANIPTTKKIILLDTCNSGKMGTVLQSTLQTRGMSEDVAIKILSRAIGGTILSASSSTQSALEGYKNHGLFTYILTEGLKGKADINKDGIIKTRELSMYVEDTVPKIAETVFNFPQYPIVTDIGQAFPIGKYQH